ncbi:Hypothetical predicted protein [Olea europaea subsp. europaea]|uniref:Uncharacterized protein n=1 Tax=Olea europaea subsp. europaea TaxID=158383 RepID=A0A8S0QH72_OLEEU|nr:Hypothetical predicted protein [Olea europaea subsp. europaea]
MLYFVSAWKIYIVRGLCGQNLKDEQFLDDNIKLQLVETNGRVVGRHRIGKAVTKKLVLLSTRFGNGQLILITKVDFSSFAKSQDPNSLLWFWNMKIQISNRMVEYEEQGYEGQISATSVPISDMLEIEIDELIMINSSIASDGVWNRM